MGVIDIHGRLQAVLAEIRAAGADEADVLDALCLLVEVSPAGPARDLTDYGRTAEYDRMGRGQLLAEVKRLHDLLWLPETQDFTRGVELEIAHQIDRWGLEHDAKKGPADWFWTLGYLGGKALAAHQAKNFTKARHHCVTVAALMGNWHRHISAEVDQCHD